MKILGIKEGAVHISEVSGLTMVNLREYGYDAVIIPDGADNLVDCVNPECVVASVGSEGTMRDIYIELTQ